ncbi:uncharacterized protein LOC124892952 isoform X2 [Capsicum annuum]|nr:uncharacterized protein LOC124892952 isoform X2 [Capsicum annuum]XP_047260082.1 uncharacterized protein LOC124892952 isoform X2 [Capsicum annuum]
MESSADKNSTRKKLKHNVIEVINEHIQAIATCHEQMVKQAVEHKARTNTTSHDYTKGIAIYKDFSTPYDLNSEGRESNVLRVSVKLSGPRGGISVQYTRDSSRKEPHVAWLTTI